MFSIQEECYPLQTAYDYFCDEFENMLGAAFGVAPAVEGLGETESDAKDLLRSTISATVNKVCLDRYLEEYRKRREQAETIVGKKSPCYSRNAVWQLQKEYPRLGRGYSLRLSAMITVQNRRTCSGPFIAMS